MQAFIAALSLLVSFQAFADDFSFEEPIDVDGYYTEKKRSSASDRMKNYRAKLEKQTEIMMKKKMEQIRLKQELEMMKRLQQSMNQTLKAMDTVGN